MQGEPYSPEQEKWIRENVSCGFFKNRKHFLATFNALFNDNRTLDSMARYLCKHGLILETKQNKPSFSTEQDEWLRQEYDQGAVFADLVKKYNDRFGTAVGYVNLISHCKTLGLHEYKSERRKDNTGQFQKGVKSGQEEAPIGTIAYNRQRDLCFIKVRMCNGKSRGTSGHDYKLPYWKPLQDKVWEDNFGEIPDGYMACVLNCNPYEQDASKIALIDKRAKAVMSRKGWWTENIKFTAVAVQWCNLYFVAKDHGIRLD